MFKPYDLVVVQHRDFYHCGQVISRETPEKTIMVRLVPNDPSTMVELPISKLKPCNCNYKYVQYAEINGNLNSCFGFPVDMLRHDFAAPVNFRLDDDNKPVLNEGETRYIIARAVERKSQQAFTQARWNSFSWGVKLIGESIKIEAQ